MGGEDDGFYKMRDEIMSDWISVKDRLPEQYEEVLVYSAKYCVQVDWIADKPYYWWNYGELVTHWQPKPEPPKGE